MCSQSDEVLIKAKVDEFVSKSKSFTSVHIANAIKTDGHWVKNSDVASWLRDNYSNIPGYIQSSILVSGSGGPGRANLYHPICDDPSMFTDTSISAMTPDEFKRIHGFDPFTTAVTSTSTIVGVLPQTKGKKIVLLECVSHDNTGRIRIPASIVKKLGLKPHQKVTDKKFAIKNIPDGLRVHKDGRVSIPRQCTNVRFGDNVKIFLKDNVVGFEKA
jgi:hypothetical protein